MASWIFLSTVDQSFYLSLIALITVAANSNDRKKAMIKKFYTSGRL